MGIPRVGILSMQRIQNYGSFLQAYGLRRVLESLGCDVQFVDYEPGRCLVNDDGKSGGSFVRKVKKAVEALSYDAPLVDKIRFINYKRTYAKRFYQMLGLTEELNLHPDIDLLVIGSDEVFNCVQDNPNVGFTPALFGCGVRARRKVSYAASFGNTTIERLAEYGKADEVGGYLKALDAVSVRDDNSAAMTRVLTGQKPRCDLDPVLLYDFMGECAAIPGEVDEKKPYLVVYGYSGRFSEEECSSVRAYADGHGLKVLNIGGVQGVCDRFVDCSPFEVISYFLHAEAIVTDTFHGTIFSVITHRPFASFVRGEAYGNSQKLCNLLGKLGLEERIAIDAESLGYVLGTPMIWGQADVVIANGREAGRSYLASQVELCALEQCRIWTTYLEKGEPADCTGCGACAQTCPVGAIAMDEDVYGFVVPVVDEKACVHCGGCARICHMDHFRELRHGTTLASYGAMNCDASALRRSASGGVANAICRHTIESDGVVYGCVADREEVHHERIDNLDELQRTQGSKYVQSDITGAYDSIAEDLRQGRHVTFVGTPCQCAAVRMVFSDNTGLTTVDLVCEGVPSRRMYADFLEFLERERRERVTDFLFRDKRAGWSTKNAVVLGENGQPLDKQSHSYYYYYYWLFSQALILRDSCYSCPYACEYRVGDVTVGDFWGVETTGLGYRLADIRAGVSCVLTNTERGRHVLDELKDTLDLRSCEVETITRSNGALQRPSKCNAVLRKKVLESNLERHADGLQSEYESLFAVHERVKADAIVNMPLSMRVALKLLILRLRGGIRGRGI